MIDPLAAGFVGFGVGFLASSVFGMLVYGRRLSPAQTPTQTPPPKLDALIDDCREFKHEAELNFELFSEWHEKASQYRDLLLAKGIAIPSEPTVDEVDD